MSAWFDADGELLGDWEPCTVDEYQRIYWETYTTPLTVFASSTQVGDRQPDGSYRDRIMVTEWGERDAQHPLIRCDDRWDYWGERHHTHARFVPIAASQRIEATR